MIAFVTGTSTGVGKTVTTAALAAALAPRGPVTVIKPAQTGFADGAIEDADGHRADTAEVGRLAPSVATVELARYPDPLAPLTAARRAGQEPIQRDFVVAQTALRARVSTVLVEGAGGVLVRLGADRCGTPFTLLDLAADLAAPVLVVADPGLGALNHTELTVRAITDRGVRCSGIVLSRWPHEPALALRCNLIDLPELTGVPVVGRVPDHAPDLRPDEFGAAAPTWFDPAWLAQLPVLQPSPN